MKVKKIIIITLISLFIVLILYIMCILTTQLYGLKNYNKSKVKIESSNINQSITLMSSNLRTIAVQDTFSHSWVYRAPFVKKNIESVNPDIIGFQEATKIHMDYLTTILADYDYEVTYRDNSLLSEGCPIFYRKDKFESIQSGSFWLSDTPDQMSKDSDASCYRICTYIILKEKETNKELVVFNTHLDNKSEDARIRGINLVLSKIEEFGFSNKASVLMGDMNDTPSSTTIENLFEVFDDGYLRALNKNDILETQITYNGYGNKKQCRIDYFAVSKTGLTVNSYNVITTTYSNEKYDTIYPSDHYPIVLDITLN